VHQRERRGHDAEKRWNCDDKAPNDLYEHPYVLIAPKRRKAGEPCFLGKPCQRGEDMTDYKRVTPDFAVAGQLEPGDIAGAATDGFTVVVVNRPDGEDPGQPSEAEMKAAAEAAGLRFVSLPYTGRTPPGVVAETAALLDETKGPVLAYCRTGKRSIMAWALAQALAGAKRPDEIIALAAQAGYDLEGARGALDTLAPKS
jgi:uncharacterized protein (TIGR01244 family)